MALTLLGTDTVASLTSLVWTGAAAQADIADINRLIRDDQNPRHPVAQIGGGGGFVKEGVLYVPNRGSLMLFPGDIVGVDVTSGQVILLTAYGLSAGPWNNA